jgi:hypothetical protein
LSTRCQSKTTLDLHQRKTSPYRYQLLCLSMHVSPPFPRLSAVEQCGISGVIRPFHRNVPSLSAHFHNPALALSLSQRARRHCSATRPSNAL